jgi:hypothetical protein
MTDTPTLTLTIQGIQFVARAPFRPGHVCTAIEAAVLNQCRADNLRNNFAKVVKQYTNGDFTATEAAAGLAERFAEYDSKYEFASPATDPIETEARRIATALVREEFNKRGLDPTAQKDRFASSVTKASTLPAIVAEAERRVAAKREAATATGLIIDGA